MDIKDPTESTPKRRTQEELDAEIKGIVTPRKKQVIEQDDEDQDLTFPGDEEDPEDYDPEDRLDEDDPEDEFQESQGKGKIIAVVVAAVVVIAAVWFFFMRDDGQQAPPPVDPNAVTDTGIVEDITSQLAAMGIGKGATSSDGTYKQGNLESDDFRKDFTNLDAPENYVQPVGIDMVTDSVSYIKHRTMTDDGIDMYWVDAQYKGKKSRFTVPYYIWQNLAKEGVMDVYVEVITDDNDNVFIGSFTAVPPSTE